MRVRTVSQSNMPTDHMYETLGKGKACLSCRARKSVSTPGLRLVVLTLCLFLEMRRRQAILRQVLCKSAPLRVSGTI